MARIQSIHSTERQTTLKETVRGTQSVFEVQYRGDPPVAARDAFRYALELWANIFPCKTVQLRVLMSWDRSEGSRTFAVAVSPFSVVSNRGQVNSALRPDAAYTPALATAVASKELPHRNHVQRSATVAFPHQYIGRDFIVRFRHRRNSSAGSRPILHGCVTRGTNGTKSRFPVHRQLP